MSGDQIIYLWEEHGILLWKDSDGNRGAEESQISTIQSYQEMLEKGYKPEFSKPPEDPTEKRPTAYVWTDEGIYSVLTLDEDGGRQGLQHSSVMYHKKDQIRGLLVRGFEVIEERPPEELLNQ